MHTPRIPPRLYAITDVRLSGCSHLDQVRKLLKAGVQWIQLRDKHEPPRSFFEQVRAIVAISREASARIIINDRVDLALAAGADGVHLGQDDMPAVMARRLLGEDRLIGLSAHNLEQAIEAEALPVDYVAMGPVFATRTKDRPSPVVGLAALQETCRRISKPVVAIGGITLDRTPDVIRAGARSVAVISDLHSRGDIETRARAYLERLGEVDRDQPGSELSSLSS